MRVSYDPERSVVLVQLEDDTALTEKLDEWRKFPRIRLEERPEEGSELAVTLASRARRILLPCRVKQVFRSGQTHWGAMLEVLDWSAAEASAEARETDLPGTEPAVAEAQTQVPVSEAQGVSPMFELKKMNPTQKALLATKATRQQRQILLRDPNPQVLLGLLAHPRIEVKEVLQLVKNPQAPSGLLQRVAADKRFSGNYEIQVGLVRNPKTPTPVAVRLVDLLRPNDLREMAKSKAIREELRKVILRVHLRRNQR
ncbi:MAG: hypothetical protein AAGA81_08125 [Acidobacteriota bacterium]